jgi:hypothetical protein
MAVLAHGRRVEYVVSAEGTYFYLVCGQPLPGFKRTTQNPFQRISQTAAHTN